METFLIVWQFLAILGGIIGGIVVLFTLVMATFYGTDDALKDVFKIGVLIIVAGLLAPLVISVVFIYGGYRLATEW